ETPVLERFDILSSKYAGGAEILKETFKLTDQGRRELALRYDLTVPLCRFIGMNPSIKFPFKRYQTGTVYRDGPVASDRLRVCTQCAVDIVGATSMAADAECIKLAENVFKKLKINATIEVNNRKFLDGMLEDIGVPEEKWVDIILIIDKMKKIEQKQLEEELKQNGLTKEQTAKLFKLIKETKGTNEEKIKNLKKQLVSKRSHEGLEEIENLFEHIPNADQKKIMFAPTLARGLAYYTGTVYEAVATNETVHSSIASGGRYDKMIGQFLGTKLEYPAVGISFGLDRLYMIIEGREKEKVKTVTEVLVIPIHAEKEAELIAESLREEGIKTETDIMGRGPSKNLQYANALKIPFVLFVGEEEVKAKKYKLKNMKTGKETVATIEEIFKIVKQTSLKKENY
ncbi:MAG: histidine--tRNA ligase, partial [Nanoarchaeota archaeon]